MGGSGAGNGGGGNDNGGNQQIDDAYEQVLSFQCLFTIQIFVQIFFANFYIFYKLTLFFNQYFLQSDY